MMTKYKDNMFQILYIRQQSFNVIELLVNLCFLDYMRLSTVIFQLKLVFFAVTASLHFPIYSSWSILVV